MHRYLRIIAPAALGVAALLILQGPWLQVRFSPPPPIVETPAEAATGTPSRLRIARLGIDAPVVEPEGRGEQAYQRALEQGVAHFPGTASAGELGNAYYFGHSSDYVWKPGAYKTVFAKLPTVQAGDEIEVTDAAGTRYFYRVTGTKVVAPKDMSVLSQGDGTHRLLTLQTSYPLGTALKRFIVLAELISR